MVGDIIVLRSGMEIPADCLVIEASSLSADESVMTGEPDAVVKNTISFCINKRNQVIRDNMQNIGRHEIPSCILMSGTNVLSGEGVAISIIVGADSC